MKLKPTVRAAMFVGALLSGSALFAAPMTNDDYRGAKSRVAAEYKAAKAACDSMKDNARDVCVEEAKGKEKVASAELEYNRSGKPKDATKLAMAKADAAYAVAREKCDDRKGNDKDVCVKEAKAAHTAGVADAKADRKVSSARRDAAEEKRDAQYNLAKEKCEALAGDNKSSCLATAKARYEKG